MTADETARLTLPGKLVELVRGRLVISEPPGTRHGAVAASLACCLGHHARRHHSGTVFAQDTGFKITSDPDTVRAPDVSFVAGERDAMIPPHGYAELAPDLLAEVLSPEDRPGEALAKIADWLSAGTRLVWVIDPDRQQAGVYRQDGSLAALDAGASLDGEDVLPGFSCPLSRILA